MADEEKGFAARWSKRKVAAREDEKENPTDQIQYQVESDSQQSLTEADSDDVDEKILTEEDFDDVDFDALDKSSDYTRFANANVPASVQKKALRKLWDSDSVFEVLDGMNDYDEDFTGDGLAGKVFKTAYQVGRGYMTEEEKSEEKVDGEVVGEIEKTSDSPSTEDRVETLEFDNTEEEINVEEEVNAVAVPMSDIKSS